MSHIRPWNAGPCHLYALVDPRTKAFFYIGVSLDPKARLSNHRSDPASSAYRRVREIYDLGLDVEIDILGTFPSRREAEQRERQMIQHIPGLINDERYLSRGQING